VLDPRVTQVPPTKLNGRSPASPAASEERRFRDVMGRFTTGVAILTVRTAETVHASTVNAITSVSLRPALLLVCLQHGSTSARLVRQAGGFGLNILGDHQSPVARILADSRRTGGLAQLADVPFQLSGTTGTPVIDEAIAWIECTVERIIGGGDHDVVFGRVRGLATGREAAPLAFFRGQYGRFEPGSRSQENETHGV
jgi:flavin reductase (DIM6/NTAB) family NADH-FMN oxidoreductase RutF